MYCLFLQVLDTSGNIRALPPVSIPASSTNFSRTCTPTIIHTMTGYASYSGLTSGFMSDVSLPYDTSSCIGVTHVASGSTRP